MPRPKSLALDDIATAALSLLDRAGLGALSMRSVADELGVGTMSLYRYVSDREHLERLVVELVLRDVVLEAPSRASWTNRLALLAERVREAVGAHPAVLPLLIIHRHESPHSIRWGEAVLGVLAQAGFSGKRRVIAFRSLLSYVIGALQVEQLGPLAGAGTRALAELPASEFPYLAETARDAQRVDPASEFRSGLALLLRGLAAEL